MWLSEAVRIAADEGGEQSRQGRSSPGPSAPQSPSQTPSAANRFLFKLNRQIPELETALTLRKQRTADCSNRQKIKFCKPRNSSADLATARPISNRELLGLEILQLAENKHRRPVLIANFEPYHRASFRAFVTGDFRRAAFIRQFPGQVRESGRRKGLRK
jgi:hypothetical protein